jgi:hypothetical protein
MAEITPAPGQAAHPLDRPAMAAFAANYGLTGEQAARRWRTAVNNVREHFRMVADAAITASQIGNGAAPAGPQPGPSRAELETAMAAALQNLIDEDDDEDGREYLSTIIEMLTVFDDDRIMIEHLLSGRNSTPEGAALLKIWEIGRRAIEGRAPSLRAILAEVLDSYGPSGSAHVSRVSRVTVIRWRIRAGLPVTEGERKMAGV